MTFSIQEEGKEKQVFFTYREASAATGISASGIVNVLKRQITNPVFTRKSDNKVFRIQKEIDVEPVIKIDEVDFFNLEDVFSKFNISQTVFFNQVLKKKNHFLDAQEISHTISWIRDDLQILIDNLRQKRLHAKVRQAMKRPENP